ncbi:glycerate kinase [Hydrocoleum sp. CS-953]|uniref:glycerate kinase n=1 Tax=Hydrocoleum sp. CS-953 TaxID=1671698 RepID=UPI000B9C1D9E|nr:glycerate kinase [Hydrocoleum sp. CS-953]OZH54088.1 glycerate kinase [Hydrocoleum sp. CS-953]
MELSNPSLRQILQILQQGKSLEKKELETLENQELIEPKRADVFHITSTNVREIIRQRSLLFQSVTIDYNKFPIRDNQTLETLWKLWLPLGIKLVNKRKNLGRPLVQGILGGQGTGKTTLAKILILILDKLGYKTISISIDDIYKTYAERQLLEKEDSRLIWRGPPGTHDVSLGIETLEKLRQSENQNYDNLIPIPRFNKSLFNGAGDRIEPEMVSKVDIVLFEGWFVGVRPIPEENFDFAPPPIITEADQKFARDMNEKLIEYLPLWEKLDSLIVLYPTDYRFSKQWRKQAEQQMIASGKSGMSDDEIEKFVDYFWQALHPELFIKPLIKNSELVDLVIEINSDHSLGNIYHPNY